MLNTYVFPKDQCYWQVSLARAVGFVAPGLCNTSGDVPYYDVVGVIGITTSSSAIVYGRYLRLRGSERSYI